MSKKKNENIEAAKSLPKKNGETAVSDEFTVTVDVYPEDGNGGQLRLTFALSADGSARAVELHAAECGAEVPFEFLSGSVRYTKLAAYVSIRYTYEPADEFDFGLKFVPVDENGAEIATIWSSSMPDPEADAQDRFLSCVTMQSAEELPKTLTFDLRHWDDEGSLGHITLDIAE